MSKRPRFVSLWAGVAASRLALNSYMTFTYDEDGNSSPCGFCRDFGFDRFDEDFLEAGFKGAKTKSLPQLLADHSDADEITPAFCASVGKALPLEANAVVLLYDFTYDGAVKTAQNGPVQLSFIGTVSY